MVVSFEFPPMISLLRTFLDSMRRHGLRRALRQVLAHCRGPTQRGNLTGIELFFSGKKGLEIGGPSSFFKIGGARSVYGIAERIDNCNFSDNTIWEGKILAGDTFVSYGGKTGRQYILEGTDLGTIESETYDFVLCSHVLEHMANPVKALLEWNRVLKYDGAVFLCVPHRDGTFDHRRPLTLLSHLEEDFRRNVDESDTTHLAEILELHDLSRDPEAGDFRQFADRCRRNSENRCLHHHVFATETVIQLLDLVGFEILRVRVSLPFDITVLARKSRADTATVRSANSVYLSREAEWRRDSPFQSDLGRRAP